MALYRLTISVRGTIATPLAADTLFGHICWAIRYNSGEHSLEEMLSQYSDTIAPLVLSDPFPVGFVPRPILERPTPEQEDLFIQQITHTPRAVLTTKLPGCPVAPNGPGLGPAEAFDVLKWLYKLRWVDMDGFISLSTNLSSIRILEHFLAKGCGQPARPTHFWATRTSIDRRTGGARHGSLHQLEQWAFAPDNPGRFQIFVASDLYSPQQIQELFSMALACGYGKAKSRGEGILAAEGCSEFEFPQVPSPNAVMLLGPCAPTEEDPTDGYWRISTRFGKLGGHWAVGKGPSGKNNPFKYPVTTLVAGSVLKTSSPRPWYGRLVDHVHPDIPKVRHYAIALTWPVRLSVEGQS